MEQLTQGLMGATGTLIILWSVEIMMTTILRQMKFVVHVEVLCQSQGFSFHLHLLFLSNGSNLLN